ncbi:MAG TPA: hypothetical protein VKB88_17120 [Bryobacteraceae bacterium]|nr:hypothetical protein [Bryobacteraceae bacterium]
MQAVERIASRRSKSSAACAANPASFATALDSAVDSKRRPFTGVSRDMVEGNMPVTRTPNRNGALAEGLCRLAAPSRLWLLMRYRSPAERQDRRAVEERPVVRSRTTFPEPPSPNEPISPVQPLPKEELGTLEDLNVNAPTGYQ